MKIKSELKMRNVAGENFVMLPDCDGVSGTSRLVSFNPTSIYLWESLQGKDFTVGDVSSLLLARYDVGEEQARQDAASWVKSIEEAGLTIS